MTTELPAAIALRQPSASPGPIFLVRIGAVRDPVAAALALAEVHQESARSHLLARHVRPRLAHQPIGSPLLRWPVCSLRAARLLGLSYHQFGYYASKHEG